MREIPAEIIMKAAVKLEDTEIYSSLNSPEKIFDWHKFIAETPNMNLKVLDTDYGDPSTVPPDVFAAALVRVEVAEVDLSEDHSLVLFEKIASTEDIKLKRLSINHDLSDISPDILAEAVVRLEEINMWNTELIPDQVQSIFNEIANCENLKLTNLDIGYNDLSTVPADVLVKAISRLEKVYLENIRHTPTQSHAIFTLVAERRSSTLRYVDLDQNVVRSVPDILREKAKENTSVQLIYDDLDSDSE